MTVPSAFSRTGLGVVTPTTSATTTRLSVPEMPISVRPLVPNACTGGMTKRIREPFWTPVSAEIRPHW